MICHSSVRDASATNHTHEAILVTDGDVKKFFFVLQQKIIMEGGHSSLIFRKVSRGCLEDFQSAGESNEMLVKDRRCFADIVRQQEDFITEITFSVTMLEHILRWEISLLSTSEFSRKKSIVAYIHLERKKR